MKKAGLVACAAHSFLASLGTQAGPKSITPLLEYLVGSGPGTPEHLEGYLDDIAHTQIYNNTVLPLARKRFFTDPNDRSTLERTEIALFQSVIDLNMEQKYTRHRFDSGKCNAYELEADRNSRDLKVCIGTVKMLSENYTGGIGLVPGTSAFEFVSDIAERSGLVSFDYCVYVDPNSFARRRELTLQLRGSGGIRVEKIEVKPLTVLWVKNLEARIFGGGVALPSGLRADELDPRVLSLRGRFERDECTPDAWASPVRCEKERAKLDAAKKARLHK